MRRSSTWGRRAACTLAVLACAAAAVACGPRVNAGGSPDVVTSNPATIPVTHRLPPYTPGTTPRSCSSRHPCGPVVPEDRIDATGLPYGEPPTTWTELRGRTVALVFTHGVCETMRGQRVSASRSEVRIRVVDTDTSHGLPCAAEAVVDTIRVRLRHPLGDRSLVLSWRAE